MNQEPNKWLLRIGYSWHLFRIASQRQSRQLQPTAEPGVMHSEHL
jgi:hypothetical protein